MWAKIKWLFPGLKLKRWIFLCILGGVLSLSSGINFFLHKIYLLRIIDIIVFILGIIMLIVGLKSFIKSMLEVVAPTKQGQIIETIYSQRLLDKGPRIVAIGGGTGLSNLLLGIKEYTRNLSAIVTVADEGGSSGRLRKEFDILPPGDIRNCLVSLADASELMRSLFQYRFSKGEGFEGHSLGNLFITAMREVTGSFDTAIKESSRILAIRGRVLPASLDKIRLRAQFIDGSFVEGEESIPKKGMAIKRVSLIPEDPKANPEAVEAIKNADVIIIGPGSLYTSILPNLLIRELREAIEMSPVLKIYVCNVMTQHGETDGFTGFKHLMVLVEHTSSRIVNCCILNSEASDTGKLARYAKENSFPVIPDREKLNNEGYWVIEDDLISREEYIRHDPAKLAKRIIQSYYTWKSNPQIRRRYRSG